MDWDCGWESCDSFGEAETGGEEAEKDIIGEDSLGGDLGVEATPGSGTVGVGTRNCEALPAEEVAGMSAAGLTSSGASGVASVWSWAGSSRWEAGRRHQESGQSTA